MKILPGSSFEQLVNDNVIHIFLIFKTIGKAQMQGRIPVVIICFTAILVSTILNILYRREFFNWGVQFIINYQNYHQTSAITVIQNIVSLFGNTFFVIALLAVCHAVFYRKLITLVFIFYIVANAYLISVEKQAFHDPRPFHYTSQIQALQWSCQKSFGFPSGHSWVSVLLYEPIISDMIGTSGFKKLLLLFIVLTGVLVPISRMYLGSHTSDQVTSGVLHSMATLLLYRFWLQQKLYNYMTSSLKGDSRMKIFILTTICLLICLAIPIALYEVNVRHRSSSQQYINNLANLNAACAKTYTAEQIQSSAAVSGALISLAFGIIYGLIISGWPSFRTYFQYTQNSSVKNKLYHFLSGNWNFDDSGCNVVKFIVVYIIFLGILLGGIALGISSAISNFYGKFVVQTIGYLLSGICLTSFIPLVLVKWDIIHPEKQANSCKSPCQQSKPN